MRFQKLRIAVAAALVIFIFIVGSVIALGVIKDRSTIQINNSPLVPSADATKKTIPQLQQAISENATTIPPQDNIQAKSNSSDSTTHQVNNNPMQNIPIDPPPAQQDIRTRAS